MSDISGRAFKNAIYEQFARIGKCVSNPKRLELLDLLAQAERTVEALAREAHLTVKSTSQHLQVLRAARLVDTQRHGLFVIYRIADPQVLDLIQAMRLLAEKRLAEIERITHQFLEGRAGMEPVDKGALLNRVRTGEATVIDVRPVEEYRARHIPGAVSIPLRELERRLSELPRDKEIVAYCRGPYCVLAIQAVEMLQAKGFRALRLADGVYEWQSRGFEITVGDERGKSWRLCSDCGFSSE